LESINQGNMENTDWIVWRYSFFVVEEEEKE
jgi:hypothetical protein